MIKRAFDVCFAVCALLALAPVLIAAALWIKLDSRGPVLFRQQRVGWHGRPFAILKLRTMRVDAPAGALGITVGADPRITRAGVFLRRYKLDELPQFFNVLRGEMSVVGPRPELPRYVATYPSGLREVVLSVRPGITDPGSLFYRDEAALLATAQNPESFYTDIVLPVKLEFAARYVQSRSLREDIRIVLRTAVAVLRL
ncbi:MAG: sugar transferase [Variovorax sp.]|nr:MAG: sugar transferase [Variovorax sp.]